MALARGETPHPGMPVQVGDNPRLIVVTCPLGMGFQVSERLVAVLMSLAGIYRLPGQHERIGCAVNSGPMTWWTGSFIVFRTTKRESLTLLNIPGAKGKRKVFCCCVMGSFGSVGDGLDNAMFDYIEISYNRERHHSGLGQRTPTDYELISENQTIPAWNCKPPTGNQCKGLVNESN